MMDIIPAAMQGPIGVLSKGIQDSVVKLCRQSSLFDDLTQGQLQIDGIICMSVQTRHDIVVKIHHTVSGRDNKKSEHQLSPSSLNGYKAVSEKTREAGQKQLNQGVYSEITSAQSLDSNRDHPVPSSSTVDEDLTCIKHEPTVVIDLEEGSPVKPKMDSNIAQQDSIQGSGHIRQDITSKLQCKTNSFNNSSAMNQNMSSNNLHNSPDFSKPNFLINNLNNFAAPIHNAKADEPSDKPHTSTESGTRREPVVIKLDDDDEDDDTVCEVDSATSALPSFSGPLRGTGTFPTNSKILFSDDDFAAYIESKAAAAAAKATNTKNETDHTGTVETAFECGVCTTYFRSNDTLVDHMKIHKKHLTAPLIKSYKSTEKVLNTKPDDEECLIMKEHKRDDSENSLDIKIVSCKSMAEVDRCDTPLGCIENSDSETSNVLNGIDHQAKDKCKNDEVTITARKEFKCEICYKCFTAKQSLKYHMFHIHKISEQHNSGSEFSSECESDTKMKPYECNICHKRFKYKNVLPLHMKTRHNTITNKSDKKGANAKHAQSEINEHNKSQVSENLSLTVSNCDVPVSEKNTGNPSNVKTSKKNIQKTPIGLNTTCEVCKKTLSSKQSLKYHMRVHTGEKPYECTVCSCKFAHKKSLIAHSLKCDIVKHKDDKSMKNYFREPDITACQIATGENAITFEPKSERVSELYCDLCHEEFQSSDMLLKHISMQHSEHDIKSQSHKHNLHHLEPLFLNKIPETAKTSKNRRKRKPVSHTCEICKKVCATKLSLTYHMRRHTGEKPFTCNICQKRFYTKQNMRYHMDFNHGPSSVNMSNSNKHTPYQCDICGKYLSSSTRLKLHHKCHTGEKPFKCSICAYSSITKTLLDNHLQTHNTEGKRFPCEVCSKLFYTKENMQSHLVIHSGEKPYSCTICNTKFARKSGLWYHRRKHHPNE